MAHQQLSELDSDGTAGFVITLGLSYAPAGWRSGGVPLLSDQARALGEHRPIHSDVPTPGFPDSLPAFRSSGWLRLYPVSSAIAFWSKACDNKAIH